MFKYIRTYRHIYINTPRFADGRCALNNYSMSTVSISLGVEGSKWLCGLVVSQVDSFSELLTVEARSKWLSLGILQLLDMLRDPSLGLLETQLPQNLPSPGVLVEGDMEGHLLSSQLLLSLSRLRDLERLDGEDDTGTEDGVGRLGSILAAMRDRLLRRLIVLDPMHRGRYRTM